MNDLLSSDGLIQRLKKGAPLMLERETVRLPRFTEIKEIDPRDLGAKGKDPLVLARARTATWALLPWPKKTGFTKKDAEAFMGMVEILQQQNPQKPVKGYVITSGPVKEEGAVLLEAGGHLASAVAE